jgi:hypothetical protein
MLITLIIIAYIYYFMDFKAYFLYFKKMLFPYVRIIKFDKSDDWKLLKAGNQIIDDGIFKLNDNLIILESLPFKKVFPNGNTCNKFVIYKNLKLNANDNEIQLSFKTKCNVNKGKNYYDDFRTGYGAIGFFNENLFIQLAFYCNKIFVLHGIQTSNLERDKFICKIPIDATNLASQFIISLTRMGLCKIFMDSVLIIEILNISVPDKNNLIFLNSQDGLTFRTKPQYIDNLNVTIGIHTLFIASDLNDKTKSLYDDGVNKNYYLTSKNNLVETSSYIKENDPSQLNFGQGCKLEVVNFSCKCF